jgi:phosphatidylserine/phosphatidylglycerophosphate/cardiolipin synthase-like enzyme
MSSNNVWFTPIGTQVRTKNFVQPLVDGEETWLRVFNQLRATKKTIHMTFWMMALDLELRRDAARTFKDPADRYEETIRKILLDKKNKDGVAVRILLWELPVSIVPVPLPTFPPIPIVIPVRQFHQDIDLRRYGQAGVFEVMYEQHPSSRIGSWHQKTIIVDGEVAFVGGMNTKENDWDTMTTPSTTTGGHHTFPPPASG